ncbi:hypothetical protein B0H63DRAFT_515424 [Podospora didyma]|uniref:Protein kinase domain-containing protein n=1 Tax=Podospora didyma TaxID=330526 RepID=A0AAE0K0A4_9PEZI|nr:hypothetical protein B0H63DRAFT_515424 [Podospora didyma]
MARANTVSEFRDYVKKYITNHGCHGETLLGGKDKVEFVPRLALAEFWTRDRVVDVLCSGQQRIRGDIQEILDDYLVIFSVLVWIERPESINIFMSVEGSLDDTKLPISFTPIQWTHDPENKATLEVFQKSQWRFCPLTLDRRRYKSTLNPFHILPITNKKLFDDDADEDVDDVLVYEAMWHPSCLGVSNSTKVILKVYHHRDKEVIATLANEVDVYSLLQDDAFEHIIRYFGSFEQQGKSTIVLEHAQGGNLVDFMAKTPPPHTFRDRFALWDSFFRLLMALNATHNLNPSAGNQTHAGQWLLKGIHQDIRPQNILIAGAASDTYSVCFKLTDFGTGHVRSCKRQGLDAMGAQRKGNGMFSAPESYRDDNMTKPQLCECDIWSLGGVGSELLVWSLKGDEKRLEYQTKRCEATGQTSLAGGFHEGSFHDGQCRLSVVDEQHRVLLESIDKDDDISRLVSHIILDHMLVANPAERSSAIKTYEAWDTAVKGIMHLKVNSYGTSNASVSSARTSQTARTGMPKRQSLSFNDLKFKLAQEEADSRRQNSYGQWFSNTVSSEPAPISTPKRQSWNHIDPHMVNQNHEHTKHGQHYPGQPVEFMGSGDPGPSHRHPVGLTRGRAVRGAGTGDSMVFGPPIPAIPEDVDDQMTSTAANWPPKQSPSRYGPGDRPTRTPKSSPPAKLPSSSSPPNSFFGRKTMDDLYGVPETGPPPGGLQDTGLGIETSPEVSHSDTGSPKLKRTDTQSSRHRKPLNPIQENPQPNAAAQDVTPRPTHTNTFSTSRPLSRQMTYALMLNPAGIITVDDIYTKIKMMSGQKFNFQRKALLSYFPRLKDALEQLKGYEGRDQIFIIDDSASMSRHRDPMGKTVRVLSKVLKEGKVDPNKNFDLYYTCSNDTFSHKNATNLQNHVDAHAFSDWPCDIYTRLDLIMKKVLEGPNPVSIYILTNGRWNANPEDPNDVCDLDKLIKKILLDNEEKRRLSNHIGIQFIRFYKANDKEDKMGRKRLEYLDDHLEAKFKELGMTKTDIVDTTDWDEDVGKMLLGGVFTDADNLPSPDQK